MGRGNGIIRGRRAPMIQTCPTCGHMRIHHPGAKLYECPTPKPVIESLKAFAKANGKRWKSILCQMWERGEGTTELIQARNMIGPKRLYKIDV